MNNSPHRIIPSLPTSMLTSKLIENKENTSLNNYNKGQNLHRVRKHRLIERNVNINDSTSSISDTTDHSGTTSNSSYSSQQYFARIPKPAISLREKPNVINDFRSSNRVLRPGETFTSFFCIREDCTDEYRRLCEEINNDTDGAIYDVGKWKKVLEGASEAISSLKTHDVKSAVNLIKLHKRATSRFPCCDDATLQNVSNKKDLLAIWLLYARVQYKYGSKTIAYSIYEHIQNSRVGEKDSSLYIELAILELDKTNNEKAIRYKNAIEIIQSGLTRGSEPANSLNEYLNKFRREEKIEEQADVKHSRNVHKIPELPKSYNNRKCRVLTQKDDGEKMNLYCTNQSPSKKGSFLCNPLIIDNDQTCTSKKLLHTSNKKVLIESKESVNVKHSKAILRHEKESRVLDRQKSETLQESDKFEQELLDNSLSSTSQLSDDLQKRICNHHFVKENINSTNQDIATKITDEENDYTGRSTLSVQSTTKRNFSNMDKKRPLLLSKVKKLDGTRLGGGYRRVRRDKVDDNVPCSESFYEEKWVKPNNAERTPPPIKKADISYMLDWTPTAPRSKPIGKLDCGEGTVPTITNRVKEEFTTNRNKQIDSSPLRQNNDSSVYGSSDYSEKKIESINARNKFNGSSPSSSSSSSPNSSPGSDSGSNSLSHRNNISVCSEENEEIVDKVSKHPPCIGKIPSSKSQNSSQSLSPNFRANADFLPIVNENNIIRINGKPFLKLGIVGKGGSCKVYRALSKDSRIVGIKKVKLAGMKKETIKGYANEIALLERLRGNPAIIQMYESEVNLKQKAIFLVMELGEVDLNNYMLQQQERLKSNTLGSYSTLNVNFIRLIWQQMLTAVHSIHEERIIHGDLKPANFLFVKGSLKLIDFGIAKRIQSDDTMNIYRENHVGTLNYMSPESIVDIGTGDNGVRVRCGRPSDVWSLGCILYQMCYKKTPFAELKMMQKLTAITNPRHKIEFPDTIDRAAINAMKSCLNRNPNERAPIVGVRGLLNEHHFLHFGNQEQD